ncbi:MAG: tetratricopeptide repeat protein [Planctomycetaceae bacterium]
MHSSTRTQTLCRSFAALRARAGGWWYAQRLLFLFVSIVLLPGCTPFFKRKGHVVKVDLSRNTPIATATTTKATSHLANGDVAKAEPYLKKALKADRRYAPAHNNMGLLHYERNDLFRAALSFQEAMRFDPQSPEPQNNLGLTFEVAGRPQAAIEHYQAAYDLAPTNPEFLGNLLRARLRSGETPFEMREELRQLLFIERRPEWIDWIEEQLELVTNPALDRGPETPDLDELSSQDGGRADFDANDRVIYDSGPESQPLSSNSLSAPMAPALSPPMPAETPYGTSSPPQSAPIMPSSPSGSVPLYQDSGQPVGDEWQEPVVR